MLKNLLFSIIFFLFINFHAAEEGYTPCEEVCYTPSGESHYSYDEDCYYLNCSSKNCDMIANLNKEELKIVLETIESIHETVGMQQLKKSPEKKDFDDWRNQLDKLDTKLLTCVSDILHDAIVIAEHAKYILPQMKLLFCISMGLNEYTKLLKNSINAK